ncbi:MAG TPA: efflux RND transporter permease subunit [Longimicrobiales bacterium]
MIRLAIRRPVAVAMTYFAVALLGVAAWRNVPIELLPETNLPQLHVRATMSGASPEVTEALLTAPLESAIQQVRGVERIESQSFEQFGQGRAEITVEFARGTDMDFARLELSERLAALEEELPDNASTPVVEPYVPDELEDQNKAFLRYTVTGPYTLEALRAHVEDVIEPEVAQVDGVGYVQVWGGRDRLLEIELDEEKLQSLGLNVWAVRQRILDLEYVRQAGVVEGQGVRHAIAIRHRAESAAEIERVPLLTVSGQELRVGDVARVHDTFEEPRSYYRIDGDPALSFTVFKESGTNTVAVADRVKARLAQIESLHPPNVRLILDEDESEDIRAQLTDMRFRATVSAGVIFVVLLLFLGSVRSAAIIFSTIAFSILITLNLIYFGGLTLNVLTLMGLAMGFGLIVDTAIVVLENIFRLRRAGEPPAVAAERGAREVVLAVLAGTLTTVVVLVPFVYLQGELRVYYVPLAIVVGFGQIASLFVGFTFIPALGARLLGGVLPAEGADALARSGAAPHASDGIGGDAAAIASGAGTSGAGSAGGVGAVVARPPFYVRIYAGMIRFTLRFPWVTVVLALAMLGGSYYLFDKYVTRGVVWGRWGQGDTYIDIRMSLPRGEELARTDELARYFERKLKTMPEVGRFVTNVQPQYAHIRVTFPDSLNLTQVPVVITEQMQAFAHQFSGADISVYGYGLPFFGGGGSSPPNYSITVLGYNYEQVRQIAEDLAVRLKRFSRIRDVDPNASGRWYDRDKATELVLTIDRRRLALHQLTAQDVVRYVSAAIRGRNLDDRIRIGGEEVRFQVKLEGNETLDVLGLQQLLIPTRTGQAVRLVDVATLTEREVLNRIVREDQQYRRNVAYEFRGPTKLGDRIHEAVIKTTRLPPGYKLEGRDEWRWSDDERDQIYGVLAVSLILIFMVTAALFESVRQPLCVLLAVPMALIGVFLIFFYTGATFTREAYIGVIMMGGVVVNNSILLVDHINQRRRRDGLPLAEAILQGTIERVRPILMTSATTVLGLLPLVLFSEAADANIWNALGYALIGGMSSSTVLVLTVTPALYLLFERRAERKRPAVVAIATLALSAAGCAADAPRDGGVRVAVDTIGGVVHVRATGPAPVLETEALVRIGTMGGVGAPRPDEFGRARSVVAGADGAIYVADAQAHEVRVFGPDGRHLRTIGRNGGGPGEFASLYAFAWIGDTLAAFDPRNARIGFLSADGAWIGSVPYPAITGGPMVIRF